MGAAHRSWPRFALAFAAAFAIVPMGLWAAAPAAQAAVCPNEAVRAEQGSKYLPECRGYEIVSPRDKGAAKILSPREQGRPFEIIHQASPGGERVEYASAVGLPGSPSAAYAQYIGARTPPAWQTTPLSPLALEPSSHQPRSGPSFEAFAADLSCGVISSLEPLTPLPASEVPGEDQNLYVGNTASGGYTLVTDVTPMSYEESTSPYHVLSVSNGCSKIVFEAAAVQLLPAAVGAKEIYEWSDGQLRLASVLPSGSSAGGQGVENGVEEGLNYAVADSSRAFFNAHADQGLDTGNREVFASVNGQSTIEVSASKTGVPDAGASFQAASFDGTRVVFAAPYGLTPNSSKSAGSSSCGAPQILQRCDLYEYELASGELRDLSADPNPGDLAGSEVHSVLGLSRDGSWVYFSATGQLVPGKGASEAQNNSEELANVYLYHEGQVDFVARVDQETLWPKSRRAELDNVTNISELAARATVDGRHVLFAARNSVTGFNNTDQITGQPDVELYEYSYSSGGGSVVCVSCDASGARPRGGVPTPAGSQEYLPRVLSEDGSRVFFESPDPLVPQASNGKLNVYEYVGGEVHLLDSGTGPEDSYFEDASAAGEDVFVMTTERLAPQDGDERRDIYDVRVDGGFPLPALLPRCKGAECGGPLALPPALEAAGSATQPGDGNILPSKPVAKVKRLTRAQKLARALRACRKIRRRKKRAACLSQARKRFGSGAAKPAGAKHPGRQSNTQAPRSKKERW